jgi:carboxyl-terminal processing protease
VSKSFEVDDAVMQEFRKFLDQEKIAYTEQQLAQDNDWIRSTIKSEVFIDAFGQEEGLKVHAAGDPEVLKALDLLPQAKQLADNAKKIVAERGNATHLSR